MKTRVGNLLVIAAILLTAISCKNEKKNEAEVSDAEEVKEAPVEAVVFTVDPAASMVAWTGSKPTGEHTGTINVAKGSVTTKYGKVESGDFTIDMTSIEVTDLEGDEKASLEGHLKGEGEGKEDHFFNVAEYPTAKFEITGITENEGKAMIKGNLTLKGKSKNISFPATSTINGDMMELTSEPFTINRTDWGVNYGSKSVFENLGDKFINDDVEVKIMVKAKKA
ncbi:YceI family protein [Aquimarina brevivitae]|uniref:Polyisoprenoid-binding protein YceI n=1 Tax=Aquimarina brevivitae TaxID=323412 RepID=A0A4Q7PHZ7_9FLAO|nr:YceI family protein [Aquimarina brevivitae]RZT00222.1 polyisoprenoid-binding protein YceI [Aquimarina brevivitae]